MFKAANSRNMSYASTWQCTTERGYSLFGNRRTQTGEQVIRVSQLYKNDGRNVFVRVRDDGTNTIIEWLNTINTTNSTDGQWEILVSTWTTAKVPIILDFNGTVSTASPPVFSDVNQTVFSNGTEAFSIWNKAFGTIASNTATVITLNSITGYTTAALQGFLAAGGTVIVDGTSYTYTGISGLTLTGLSALPAFTANTGVAEAIFSGSYNDGNGAVTLSGLTKVDTGIIADSRLFGSRIDASTILIGSQAGRVVNYTTVASPGITDPIAKSFVEGQDGVIGFAAKDEVVFLLGRNWIGTYTLQFASTTRQEVIRSIGGLVGTNTGLASKLGVCNVDGEIWYASKGQGILTIFTDDKGNFKPLNRTEDVWPTIKDFDFGEAAMVYHRSENIVLCACKSDSNQTINDRAIIFYRALHEDGNRTWEIDIKQGWFFNDFAVTNDDRLIGASSLDGNTYELFDGYSHDGGPYTSLRTFKRLAYDLFHNEKQQFYIPMTGGLTPGTTMNIQLDFDYAGSRAHLETSLVTTESDYFVVPTFNTIGALELGTEPIGGLIEAIEDFNYFRIFLSLPREYSFYDFQLTVYTEGTGQRMFIENVGLPQMERTGALNAKEVINAKYIKSMI